MTPGVMRLLQTGLLLACGLASAQVVESVFTPYQAATDRAVEQGLRYLAERQEPSGEFNGTHGRTTGVVSLCGMAFLSKGHLPGLGPYGETLDRCVDYVLDHQEPDGMLVRNRNEGKMYSHSISTLFLSEVSGMVDPERQARIAEVLPRALKLLLDAQSVPKEERHRGGWRYMPDSTDSDLSCSGWALMALRSSRLNGAPVPDEAIDLAVQYILRNREPQVGHFGYQDPHGHRESLTGMALLCLELCGYHGDDMTRQAGRFVLRSKQALLENQFNTYGNYYNAQGTFQLGGAYWQEYAAWMYDTYLPMQLPDGSWPFRRDGELYNTALVVLALTVPYRQLPIYQRDETVDLLAEPAP